VSVSQTRPSGLSSDEGGGRIVRVGDDRRQEAVHCLTTGSPQSDGDQGRRFLDYAHRNRIDLEAMWARLDERGRVIATVLAVPNPGRTAMVFANRPRREDEVQPLAALIDHACGELSADHRHDVHLAQALVDPADRREREAFERGRFRYLADLSYLERPLPGSKVESPVIWPEGVRVRTYDQSLRPLMVEVLEASYEQTLDCPGLLGLRRSEDILCGHMATGEFDPALWTLLEIDDRPAGALLLNPSLQGNCVELVYLGLAPFARRRGLGRRLLHHGLDRLRGRPERIIMLAVDEGNAPALRLYRSEGFRRVLRRVALIRPF
jgi:ribosomal protein S18 acetylase RimI-like enzyme